MLTRAQTVTLAGLTALAPLAIDMYLPALPPLAADLGVSVERAAQSISVFLFGIAGGQLVAGPLSDRFGRKPLILAGLLLFLGSSIVAATTDSFMILLAARLAQAFGACAAMVSGRAVVRDLLDEREGARFFSMLALVGGLAPVLAPLLGAVIISIADWRAIFWVMVAFGLIMLLSLPVLGESRSQETASNARSEHPFRGYLQLLGNRTLQGYLLAAMFNSAGFFAYVANSSVVLVSGYGLTPTEFSLVFGVNSIALVGAAQINRTMLKTRDTRDMLRMSARNALILAALLALFAITGWGGFWGLLAILFFMVGSVTPVQANTMAGGLAADPLRAGSAAALFGAATFASGALASWIAGAMFDGTARGLCIVIAACLVGVAVSIRFLIPQPEPKPAQAD